MVFENRDGKHILRINSDDDICSDSQYNLDFLSDEEVRYYYKIFKKEHKERIFSAILFVLFWRR